MPKPRLIDLDNMRCVELDEVERRHLVRCIDQGCIEDADGVPLNLDEVEDRDGDLIVDEVAYETCKGLRLEAREVCRG